MSSCLGSFFFFFQAEDGIRDLYVTGVQTCALPILGGRRPHRDPRRAHEPDRQRSVGRLRSEERRVGKECRSRWSPDHSKKKKEKSRQRDIIDSVSYMIEVMIVGLTCF